MYFACRFRRRKDNLDLAMAKLNEGNLTAASELFQVFKLLPFMVLHSFSVSYVNTLD